MSVGACLFCEIVAGRAPASVVYQDQRVLAFLDIRPVTPGHTLIVPKRHADGLADLDDEDGAQAFRVARRLAGALRASGLRCEGVNLFVADGAAAMQEIFHFHLHVFPRYRGDSFRVTADWSQHPTRSELDNLAATIGNAM
jgi:diadenosine tetraphosphate (Ap4A) HIT family hydrolase